MSEGTTIRKIMRLRSAALLTLCLILTGCETSSFVGQAVHGQVDMWRRETRISTLLQKTNTPAETKRRLELVQTYRKFAQEKLGLPAGRSYLGYADLERPFVSWTVAATPEFSMEDEEWWFPIVGSVSYRGYFKEEAAKRHATMLKAKGMDVSIGGVAAYSTLGWFADPVLNTFLFDPEEDLADLIFHELAHRRLYVSGDTDFNEAFATFVAQEGLRRWFRAHPDAAMEARWNLKEARQDEFRRAVLEAGSRLKVLYALLTPGNTADIRAAKSEEIARLRIRLEELTGKWAGEPDISGWLTSPINNARINSVATYYRWVPAFAELLKECSGDLPRFYGEVKRLGKIPKAERLQRLESLLAAGSRASQ